MEGDFIFRNVTGKPPSGSVAVKSPVAAMSSMVVLVTLTVVGGRLTWLRVMVEMLLNSAPSNALKVKESVVGDPKVGV